MAKLKVTGLDMYAKQLSKLANEAEKINRGALGEGAGMVAEKIGAAIESLPVRPDKPKDNHKLYGVTADEKSQIIDNFGIARFRSKGGGIDTSIGFTGYVDTPSAKFNDHVPTGMLVQCVEYGTDFRQGTRTISKAINAVKKDIPKAIQDYIDKETQKIMK